MQIRGGRTIVQLVTDLVVQLYGLWLSWSKRTHYMLYSLLPFGVGSAHQVSWIETFFDRNFFRFPLFMYSRIE